MGCHTWCYRKKKDISNEEISDLIKKNINHSLDFYKKKENKRIIKYFNNLLKVIDNNNNNYSILERMFDLTYLDCDILIHKKVLYESVSFHDLFRVGNYPEDILLSLERTNDFINNHKVYNLNIEKVNEFWTKYPKGLIHFG